MGTSRRFHFLQYRHEGARRPYTFVVSVVAHICRGRVHCLRLYFCSSHQYEIRCGPLYACARSTSLCRIPCRRQNSAKQRHVSRKQNSTAHTTSAHNMPAAPTSSPLQVPKLHIWLTSTIVQPDIPPNQLITKAKLPSLLLWSAQRPKIPTHHSAAAQKLAINNTRPVLTRPTPETHVSDVPMTSTPFESDCRCRPPAASTPVVVSGATLGDLLPETTSKSSHSTQFRGHAIHLRRGDGQGNNRSAGSQSDCAPAMRTARCDPARRVTPPQSGTGDPNSSGAEKGAQQSRAQPETRREPRNAQRNGAGNGGNSRKGEWQPAVRERRRRAGNRANVYPNDASAKRHVRRSRCGRLLDGRRVSRDSQTLGRAACLFRISSRGTVPELDSAILASVQKSRQPVQGNMNHIEAPWPTYIVRPSNSPANVNADALDGSWICERNRAF